MKILVIPDIHGNWINTIQHIIDNKNSVDKIVTLGDYFDDFDEKLNGKIMIDGFKKLIELKKSEPEKFELLLGNHCLSYISDPNVSGHHYQYASAYRKLIMDNLEYLNIITEISGYYFSHAGVSTVWYKWFLNGDRKKQIIKNWNELKTPVEKINAVFHSGLFGYFDYNNQGGDSGDGDSVLQGPLWIRPNSLLKCPFFDKQIVGHTEVLLNVPYTIKIKNKIIVLTDTSNHNGWFILDTEKELKIDKEF